MRYRSTLTSIILSLLLLLSVTATLSQNEYPPEFPIAYVTLRGFGIKYEVAFQLLGVNNEAKILNINQGLSPKKYDFRVWIWQRPGDIWTFKNVALESTYFVFDVCSDPLVEGIFFDFTDGRRHLLYPQRPNIPGEADRGLVMHMLKIETWQERIYIQGCGELEDWHHDKDRVH